MLPLIGLAIPQTAQRPVTLGAFDLAGKTVQATLPPPESLPAGADVTVGGQGYRIPYHQNPLEFDVWPEGKSDDRWADLEARWTDKASQPVAQWHTKFIIFSYTDILDKDKEGILRKRGSGFFGGDKAEILQSIALFGSLVEAYSGGKLEFKPDVTFEEDPMRFDVPEEKPYDSAFADHYFQSRINGGYYEADDHIYRGPYSSVFFLHSGLDNDACFTSVNGMPVSGLPFYFRYDAERPGELAVRLFDEWYKQLVFDLARHGFQFERHFPANANQVSDFPTRLRLPTGLMSDSMWAVAANARDTNDYPDHFPPRDEVASPWSKVREQPFVLLPHLSTPAFAEQSGGDLKAVQNAIDADHSISLVKGAQQEFVLAEPDSADFVAGRLGGDPTCMGFVAGEDGPKLAFETAVANGAFTSAQGPPTPTSLDFTSAPLPPVFGYFSEKLVSDSGKQAIQIQPTWVSKAGGVVLFRFDGPPPESARFLDLQVKPAVGVFSVCVTGSSGSKLYSLGRSPAPPSEAGTAAEDLNFTGGDWQDVVIPLDSVGELREITIGQGFAAYHPIDLSESDSILIAGAKLVESASPTALLPENDQPDPTSPDSYNRELFAARANSGTDQPALIKLLDDPDQEVQMNAAAAFVRIKNEAAVPPLFKLAKKLDPRLVEMALAALIHQGTKEAVADVVNVLQTGPFDGNKYYAALMLAPAQDTNLEETYSLLITSKSWQTRLAAVNAIASMPGVDAQKYLLGLLEETDPEIEATIAQRGSTSWEDFDKRMEWYSINDPSDWMRASSNIALLRSELPAYRAEGLKGLKDDSWAVRVMILEYLGSKPDPSARPAIVGALQDSAPEVRQAALLAIKAYSPTNLNELGHVISDRDERVQTALLILAGVEHLTLPKDTMKNLLASPDPEVVELASKLNTQPPNAAHEQ